MNVNLNATEAINTQVTFACLVSLMDLSSRLAARACDVMETDAYKGAALMEDADFLTEGVGILAECSGHSVDDVFTHLWNL